MAFFPQAHFYSFAPKPHLPWLCPEEWGCGWCSQCLNCPLLAGPDTSWAPLQSLHLPQERPTYSGGGSPGEENSSCPSFCSPFRLAGPFHLFSARDWGSQLCLSLPLLMDTLAASTSWSILIRIVLKIWARNMSMNHIYWLKIHYWFKVSENADHTVSDCREIRGVVSTS